MLDTIPDLTPERLRAHDQIPGRGVVAATSTRDGYVYARFTNGNEARYRPGSTLTVHRPA